MFINLTLEEMKTVDNRGRQIRGRRTEGAGELNESGDETTFF